MFDRIGHGTSGTPTLRPSGAWLISLLPSRRLRGASLPMELGGPDRVQIVVMTSSNHWLIHLRVEVNVYSERNGLVVTLPRRVLDKCMACATMKCTRPCPRDGGGTVKATDYVSKYGSFSGKRFAYLISATRLSSVVGLRKKLTSRLGERTASVSCCSELPVPVFPRNIESWSG